MIKEGIGKETENRNNGHNFLHITYSINTHSIYNLAFA